MGLQPLHIVLYLEGHHVGLSLCWGYAELYNFLKTRGLAFLSFMEHLNHVAGAAQQNWYQPNWRVPSLCGIVRISPTLTGAPSVLFDDLGDS